jgi:hypothetical protein
MRFLVAAAMLSFVPSASFAQQSSQDVLARLGIKVVQPMSAKEVTRTRSRVAAELARAGATSLFEDLTDEYGGKARHRASGLICPLGKKGQRVLQASPDSAACETSNNGAIYRTSVVRAPAGAALQSVAASTLAAAAREPGYKPATGLSVTADADPESGRPEHRTLRYFSRVGGRERAVRVQVGLVRGWVLTNRRETKHDTPSNSISYVLEEATFGTSMKAD